MTSVLIELKCLKRPIFVIPAGLAVQICNNVIVTSLGNEMSLFERCVNVISALIVGVEVPHSLIFKRIFLCFFII